MKFWLPKKRGQHGRDPKLGLIAVLILVGFLAFAFWLGAQM